MYLGPQSNIYNEINEISEPGFFRAVFFKELYALVGGIRTSKIRNDGGRVCQVLGIRVLDA
ncbi:hypothetical protein [Desulfobacula phenolica]|uniref:Uncharacterized protein n=1 Tax=Desulfobacula phenolica TaxID=90732 RepID=A0A1H2I2U8_9BACT|nr:hypothetical protein [Desulfobacula phenolica]SDU38471.1 hypothetical protein SAMN04487931_107203 [Desulfobacula phenolica]